MRGNAIKFRPLLPLSCFTCGERFSSNRMMKLCEGAVADIVTSFRGSKKAKINRRKNNN